MLKEFIGSATQRLAEIGGEVTAGIDIPAELLEMTTFDATAPLAPNRKLRLKSPLLPLGNQPCCGNLHYAHSNARSLRSCNTEAFNRIEGFLRLWRCRRYLLV